MPPRSPADPDPLLDRPDWAPAWTPVVDDVRAMRALRMALTAVLCLGLVSCITLGADQPADPVLVDPATELPAGEPSP